MKFQQLKFIIFRLVLLAISSKDAWPCAPTQLIDKMGEPVEPNDFNLVVSNEFPPVSAKVRKLISTVCDFSSSCGVLWLKAR